MAPRDSILRVEAAVSAAGGILRQRGANIFRTQGACHLGDDPETLVWIYSQDRGHINPYCHKQCDREVILDAYRLREADLYDEPLKRGNALWTPKPGAPRPVVARPEARIIEPGPPGWHPDPIEKIKCRVGEDRFEWHAVVAEYLYATADARVCLGVIRCDHKDFRQWHPEKGAPHCSRRWGKHVYDERNQIIATAASVPYRLRHVLAGIEADRMIWIPEGEKDAESLATAGAIATCCPGGSGMGWDPGVNRYFTGADIRVVADRDKSGRKLAEQIVKNLMGVARSIDVVIAKTGKDATDHLDAGHGIHEFVQVWEPKPLNLAEATA